MAQKITKQRQVVAVYANKYEVIFTDPMEAIKERIEVLLHEMQYGSRKTMIDEIIKDADTDMYELAVMDDRQLRNAISTAIRLKVQEIIEASNK